MRSIEELSKLLYETVLELVKLHSENSILIKKNIVEINFNYLNTRGIYYLLDSQKITLQEFDLKKRFVLKNEIRTRFNRPTCRKYNSEKTRRLFRVPVSTWFTETSYHMHDKYFPKILFYEKYCTHDRK